MNEHPSLDGATNTRDSREDVEITDESGTVGGWTHLE